MKKLLVGALAALVLAGIIFVFGSPAVSEARETAGPVAARPLVSPNIVISQIYGGGGVASGSQYANDFVELFNRGSQPVSLNGWSTQYASSGGTNWLVTPLPNVTLQPGQYFLIQYAANSPVNGGGPLPTPDAIAPAVTVNGNTFIPNLSSTSGKIALVNSTTQLPASACPSDASIVDLLGYGAAASCFEGTRAADLTATTGHKRAGGGCTDTDNNANDFAAGPPAPRNTSSPTSSCNLGSQLQAGINANPNVVSPNGNTLLTVSVIPATTPPSTGITVVGNLTDIGGSASQTFFDDGTNGDVTPGDNVYSFRATIPGTFTGGTRVVTAVASDAQARSVNLAQSVTINAPLPNEDPLILGNPSNATPDPANENNYLMPKPQYTLSYNRSKATPNWVAWRLDSSWLGTTPRQDDYRPDPALPAGWYQVQDNDYSGSGYDRGHMCPSGDRTNSVANNSATFLMTNFVPQLPANNQGPWEDLESYSRTLAQAGNELYIIDGPVGQIGTIAGGRIAVPQYTWKVVLVLPNGDNDLARINKATRAFGIVVPNFSPLDINAPWRNFRVTVDQVERLTGYNFFSNVPKNTQEIIERRRDRQ
ncbi:MAG: DNA/RNA non-specific endonuclease [Pyrinomonadaceae bacterium]